jgi:hypothetical protein
VEVFHLLAALAALAALAGRLVVHLPALALLLRQRPTTVNTLLLQQLVLAPDLAPTQAVSSLQALLHPPPPLKSPPPS